MEEFLNDVRMYGNRLSRFDYVDENGHDETKSVFIYEYEGKRVIFVMCCGSYVEYWIKEVI